MFRIRCAIALASVLVLATGCEAADGERAEAGELIATYSESFTDEEWVRNVDLPTALVLASASDINAWVQTLPDPEPTMFEALYEVDLTEHFLVIGGYHQCTESSSIVVTNEAVEFEVTAPDPDTLCSWSPFTLDVWAVPLALTNGEVPSTVPITYGSEVGSTAVEPSATIGQLLGTWDESTTDREALEAVVTEFRGPVTERNVLDDLAAALTGLGAADSVVDSVQQVAPGTNFLLLTGYPSCTERSAVRADLQADPTVVWIEIAGDTDVDCVWAPYTVDVWQVDLSEVGDFRYDDERA